MQLPHLEKVITAKIALVKKLTFSKGSRILTRAEFQKISEIGRKIHCRSFIIFLYPTSAKDSRLGVTVSKKVELRATRRNLIKRRIREWFRQNQQTLSGVFDIVIVARKNACALDFAGLKRELQTALVRDGYADSNS